LAIEKKAREDAAERAEAANQRAEQAEAAKQGNRLRGQCMEGDHQV